MKRRRSSISFGRRLVILWWDPWTNRHGLSLELKVGRRIYAASFGYGEGIRLMRGWA